MLFEDYKMHPNAQVRPSLLWEFDLARFNWQTMRDIVVQRVLERGRILYGEEGVKAALKAIPYMSDKNMNFACVTFNLGKEELKCYTKKQSATQHWNSCPPR